MRLDKKEIDRIVTQALKEDVGPGDITTNSIVSKGTKSCANFYSKEDGIIAGLPIAKSVFKKLDKKILFKSLVKEGEKVSAGTLIAQVKGPYRALLTGERTALNILQRVSGIATFTSRCVEQTIGTKAQILDTRKTAPGLRMLDKYAVNAGGGRNHRIGLYDMVLIKDNHIKVAGSITAAAGQVRRKLRANAVIEIETSNIGEVFEALNSDADIIMLDNMSNKMMAEAVAIIDGRAKTEASGNMNLKRIRSAASTGVDFISIGALTHSVKALDINMKFENQKEKK